VSTIITLFVETFFLGIFLRKEAYQTEKFFERHSTTILKSISSIYDSITCIPASKSAPLYVDNRSRVQRYILFQFLFDTSNCLFVTSFLAVVILCNNVKFYINYDPVEKMFDFAGLKKFGVVVIISFFLLVLWLLSFSSYIKHLSIFGWYFGDFWIPPRFELPGIYSSIKDSLKTHPSLCKIGVYKYSNHPSVVFG
jgi:hypothetical protein